MTRRDFMALFVGGHKGRPYTARARTPASKKRAAVVDREACIAWGDGPCRICETRCPIPGALTWDGGPVIDAAACDGCGKCVDACVAVNVPPAISIVEREG